MAERAIYALSYRRDLRSNQAKWSEKFAAKPMVVLEEKGGGRFVETGLTPVVKHW